MARVCFAKNEELYEVIRFLEPSSIIFVSQKIGCFMDINNGCFDKSESCTPMDEFVVPENKCPVQIRHFQTYISEYVHV